MGNGFSSLILCVWLVLLTVLSCGDSISHDQSPPVPGATPVGRFELGNETMAVFDDHSTLGRISYLTHIPTGSQVVLDEQSRVIVRHSESVEGDELLDKALADPSILARISEGLSYNGRYRQENARDFINFIMLNDIFYLGKGSTSFITLPGEKKPGTSALGPIRSRIAFRHFEHIAAGSVLLNGDAAYLEPGTSVHEVLGYAPWFRLGVQLGDRVYVFEAESNPNAQKGADLLDIDGKVLAMAILDADGKTELGRIDDRDRVRELVSLVLSSDVVSQSLPRDDTNFIGFWLADGTAAVRPYSGATGRLADRIATPPAFQQAIAGAIGGS